MLKITVERIPHGYIEERREIASMKIANIGRGNYHNSGNYVYTIDEPVPILGQPIKSGGVIKDYYRLQSVFNLVNVILNDVPRDLSEQDLLFINKLREKEC